nr:MAG TPA: hypothetical protein [Caudoviricetes sp.]
MVYIHLGRFNKGKRKLRFRFSRLNLHASKIF